jgi:hypothetical protein
MFVFHRKLLYVLHALAKPLPAALAVLGRVRMLLKGGEPAMLPRPTLPVLSMVRRMAAAPATAVPASSMEKEPLPTPEAFTPT